MQNMIAPYLKSTCELIQRAFPKGIDSAHYFPLLALLNEEISDRNLAEAIAYCTEKPYPVVLNDIYAVRSTHSPASDAIALVKEHLLEYGYDRWLEED